MPETTKPENTRICEECKTRKTIHPNSPLCASCMAKRPKKPKDQAERGRKKREAKPEGQGKDPGEKSSPGGDLTLVIDFGRYASVLDEVKDLAEEEMRPVDLQCIFMLREYLRGMEEERHA
ncbi:MAG: hypothetical protein AB1512_13505 [Thermodesulfobacteriota bacterium]